ncbi:DUF6538 domain-containing protein [Brevundimonas sp. DC300-4]|uniref:DUF6538 domain-containing protein n=1 Tax=Brevundimonas sp. DC300-4 TaxID=2804594 RepID=UPI003CE87C60
MPSRTSRVTRKLNPGIYGRPDGKLQAHLKIPADLHFAYGRTKRVVSLETDDPDEANRRHAKEVSKDLVAFESLRRGTASETFEAFARQLHAAQTHEIARVADEQLTAKNPSPNVYTAQSLVARLNTDDPDELAATVGWAADAFFAQQMNLNFSELPDTLLRSAVYRQVLRECAEVLKDSWRAGREIEFGRAVSPPRYPALRSDIGESPDGNRALDPRAAWPFSRYFREVYQPDHRGEIEDGSAKIKEQSVDYFVDLLGDKPVFRVTRADVSEFQGLLRYLPDGRILTGSLKGKSARELVDLQKGGGSSLKRLAAATINRHVGNIKTVLASALDAGHIRLNPTLGLKNVKPNASNPVVQRRPFSGSELKQIFDQPMYAGCAGDDSRGLFRPGSVMIRDERFWIPMLCFLTGARASEIAGLEKPEVIIGDGVDRIVFRFTPLRRLKNKDTERVIPLHPWAMMMGFDEYLRTLPATTSYLFPKVVEEARDAKGVLSDHELDGSCVFRQFNRTILKHVGLDQDPSVSLHSFRHVFEDAMTGKNIPEEVMFRLTGRATGGIHQDCSGPETGGVNVGTGTGS